MFPKIIYFKNDSTEAELQNQITENKIVYGIYKYTKAKVFLGKELKFTQVDIERLIKKEIIETNE